MFLQRLLIVDFLRRNYVRFPRGKLYIYRVYKFYRGGCLGCLICTCSYGAGRHVYSWL